VRSDDPRPIRLPDHAAVDTPDGQQRTYRRATAQPVRSIKAYGPRTTTHVPRPTDKHQLLGKISDDRHALYLCAIVLGLRRGELLGLTWEVVREIAGHSDIKVTMMVYTHGRLDEKAAALTQLGTAVSGSVAVNGCRHRDEQ
jgi:integrase